ncbi:MAG TPA: PfkB family carbohydrate kinase [Streptosporangiaceae bacterium]|nr:PfkB family carbohydrate kinase [Streptosporangiaceae bacterium]
MVVTLNPALDVTHVVDRADWAGVNRPHAVHVRPGGKGVNVARMLRALGADVTLAGLAGGGTGRELLAGLRGAGIRVALTPVAGETRRTFAVVDSARGETALFNEPGPRVSQGEYLEFFVRYEKAVGGCAAVVLSGSLPPGLPDDAYASLIGAAAAVGVPVVLDASGAPLRHGAAAGPALVKPNLAELEAAAGRSLATADGPDLVAIEHAARRLVASATRAAGGTAPRRPVAGAGAAGGQEPSPQVDTDAGHVHWPEHAAVVVSLGPHGLLALTLEGTWHASPARPMAGNPTGAGDAVVAALAHGLVRRQDWPDRLRHAAALGAASVAAPAAGEFHAEIYRQHLAEVRVAARPAVRRQAAGESVTRRRGG